MRSIDPTNDEIRTRIGRRAFLGRSTAGVGTLALASLLDPSLLRGRRDVAVAARATDGRGTIHPLHFAPKAKRIIYLYMAGGPSHLETLDSKPDLARMHGQPMPESFTKGMPIAQLQGQKLVCFAPQHPFRRCGSSGQEISAIFPHVATIADEICIIRSMVTEAINHDPAHTFMNTGTTHLRPAGDGVLAHLRPGQRERRPAGLRRPDLDRPVRPGAADLDAAVAQRVPAQPVPGRPVLLQGRPGPLPGAAPGARPPTASATSSTPSSSSISSRTSGRRPRDRHADHRVRDGVPHADQRPRADRPLQRAEARARPLRHRGRRRLVRRQLPAGPPAGRARRPVHPALSSRLGPSRRDQGRTSPARPRRSTRAPRP